MTAAKFSVLAAVIFLAVAVLQLARALLSLEVKIGATSIPIWASWIAFVVAGALALLGFTAQ